ncbi:Threonyl/alanyl tRNA synthetase [Mycena olivaceomarginata]|nr:Threonyl/alanyl tRNA synthetase [Mycena olivaceomarginata]
MIPSLKPRKLGRRGQQGFPQRVKRGTTDTVKLDVHDIASLEKNAMLGNTTATIKSVFHNKTFVESTADIPDNASFGLILDKTTIGSKVASSYDELRRWPLRNNYTATHILNFCLREVLGDHIDQKGSPVAPTKLRFAQNQIGLPEIGKIESMSLRAVFGESYPDPIRVVTLEYEIDEIAKDITNPKWRNTSTGDIKDFVIIEESGIAKGIRRITAVTGHEAQDVTRLIQALKARLDQLELLSGQEKDSGLKTPSVELGQGDISVVLKAELKECLAVVRKAFNKQIKEKEAAANKEVCQPLLIFGGN